MRSAPPPPTNADAVTPIWLSAALQPGFPGARVAGIAFDAPIHGSATNIGLRVEYEPHQTHDAPDRLWLKACYEDHFDHYAASTVFEREALFYKVLAPRLSVHMPDVYYSEIDPATHQGVMLMADLAAGGATFGDVRRPIAVASAERCLEALAKLHAATWGEAAPRNEGFIDAGIASKGPTSTWFREQTPEVFARYLAARADANVPAAVADPERIVAAFWALADRSLDEPMCLIHADCHLDNFFFEADGTPGLTDWQAVRLGCWAWDVSYFTISALDPGVRRTAERDLLKTYLAALAAAGAPAPAFEDAWLLYRQYSAYSLFVKIVNPDVFKPREINVAWMSRATAAAAGLDTFGSLGV